MSKRSDARIRELLASMASIASDLSVTAITHRVLDEAMSIYAAASGLLELTNASHQKGQLAKGKDALALREPAGKDEPKRLRLELRTRQELFALLTLGPKNGKDRYSKADQELGAALAGSASVALENAQLYQDAADRARWLAACARIGGLLGGESRHHTQGLNDVAELARRESRARYALLLTPIAQSQGTDPGYRIAGISQNVHPHLAGRVLLHVGERENLRLHHNKPMVLPTPEPIVPLGEIADGAHTLVAALSARGTHYGLLLMVREQDAEEYGPVETQMAGIFADNIAQGLGLVQVHHLREDVLLYLERERIARDLHDIVIQRIFAAGLGISALRKQLPTRRPGAGQRHRQGTGHDHRRAARHHLLAARQCRGDREPQLPHPARHPPGLRTAGLHPAAAPGRRPGRTHRRNHAHPPAGGHHRGTDQRGAPRPRPCRRTGHRTQQ